ncbi:iron ABC transporter, partial [Candidatus Acetothermia bacterium]
MNQRRTYFRRLVCVVLLVLTVPTILVGVAIGPVHIPLSDTLSYLIGQGVPVDGSPSVSRLIISQIRLPRVLLGLLVGCALAISGGTMQGLFRNPLASPYVLGVASGASTGASLVILLNLRGALFLPLGAFIGGLLAAGIVYRLAQERTKKTSVYT